MDLNEGQVTKVLVYHHGPDKENLGSCVSRDLGDGGNLVAMLMIWELAR